MGLLKEFDDIYDKVKGDLQTFEVNKLKHINTSKPTLSINEEFSVGITSLPAQTQNRMAKRGAVFNLLLVGQSGLGKTTFINTLLGTSLLPNVWHNVEEVEPNVEFEKVAKIRSNKLHLVENGFNLDFTVVDAPGFSDAIDNQFSYVPITEYIDDQLRAYMLQYEQPDRRLLVDNRTHACIYFINPSSKGLSATDVEAMRHISRRVNLIPVIAKADTLTTEEVNSIKSLIRQIIEAQEIKICEFFEDEEVKSRILEQIPYSLIGSESFVVKKDGTSVRGRKYDWGIAEVENEHHCDFVKLRDILMSTNLADLISTTESYYQTCRDKLIRTRIKQAKESLPDDYFQDDYNFEDPDLNGLKNYKVLSKFNKAFVDDLVIEWNPIFLQRQLLQRKRYNEVVAFEEKKFKEWKKALFVKQATFNDEIQQIHQQIRQINADIGELKRPSQSEPSGEISNDEDNHQQVHGQEGESALIQSQKD